MTGAAVVGTGTVVGSVVVVEAGGMVWTVVEVAAVVIGWVGGTAAWVVRAGRRRHPQHTDHRRGSDRSGQDGGHPPILTNPRA